MTWGWESYPEYLDVIEKQDLAIDVGSQIAHGTVRAYAMGERGARNEPATPEDIAAMARLVQEAVEAGALGFSTSRTIGHRAMDGEPVPGTLPQKTNCSGSAGRWRQAGGPSSNWPRRESRARTSSRRRRNWSGCSASAPRSTGRSHSA